MSVCLFLYGKPIQKICVPKCVGGIMWPKHVYAQSQFWVVKADLCHLYYSFLLYARSALVWTKKKHSLRNEKLKANRASETEEQRRERLRIRCEKDGARSTTKIITTRGKEKVVRNRRPRETEDHEKQCLATLKRLKLTTFSYS